MKPFLYLLCCLTLFSTMLCRTTPAQTQNNREPAAASKSPKDELFRALEEDPIDLDAVRKLLDKDPTLVRARDEEQSTALLVSAKKNEGEELIPLLLSKGADVNAKNVSGATSLHVAAEVDLTENMKLLLANKANVNAADSDGVTPLHLVKSKEAAEILLASGANIEAKTSIDKTPLIYAVSDDQQLEVVEFLLNRNANVSAASSGGYTALHEVAGTTPYSDEWKRKVTELLIAHKADVNAKTDEGETPLKLAIQAKNKVVADILRKHGAKE